MLSHLEIDILHFTKTAETRHVSFDNEDSRLERSVLKLYLRDRYIVDFVIKYYELYLLRYRQIRELHEHMRLRFADRVRVHLV